MDSDLSLHMTTETAFLFDTARFEHLQRIASLLAASSLIPECLTHGKNKQPLEPKTVQANCFLVLCQAIRWGFDPFALMGEAYVTGGKVAFQGKVIAAAVNEHSGIMGSLSVKYSGSGDNRTALISGQYPNEAEPRTIEVVLGKVRTDNKLWREDPDQKLFYTGAIRWARRHAPQVVFGIVAHEEGATLDEDAHTGTFVVDARAVTKPPPAIEHNPSQTLNLDVQPEPEIVPVERGRREEAQPALSVDDAGKLDLALDACDTAEHVDRVQGMFGNGKPAGIAAEVSAACDKRRKELRR